MAHDLSRVAKIQAPVLHDPVPRFRVFDELDRLRERRVVWVGGPAGAGKSTLVASYLRHRRLTGLWLRVDAGDVDPASFFFFLTALAEQVSPARPPALPLLTPEYLLDFDGYIRRYFRAFFQRLPAGSLLVLDNCQEAQGEVFPKILQGAAKQVPADHNLILISRTEAPNSWAHLQAAGQMGSLGWDTLRLDPEECCTMARQYGVQSSQETDAILAQADGWAAGLVLICTAVQRSGSRSTQAQARSRESIFDLFAGEVFSGIPSDERHMLVRLALFDQFSAPMARALTGVDSAQEMLDRLHRQHYFTDKLNTSDDQYQFHPLFREFLLKEFDGLPVEARSRLHAQAAAIAAQCGTPEEAARLLQLAQDWDGLARVVLMHAESMLDQGRWQTVQLWIESLPESVRAGMPWIDFWLGVSYLKLDQSRAIAILETAYGGFVDEKDLTGQILSTCGIINAFYFQLGRFTRLDHWLERLEALMRSANGVFPSTRIELHVNTALLTGSMLRRPDHRLFGVADRVIELVNLPDVTSDDKILVGSIVLQYCVLAADMPRCERLLRLLEPTLRQWTGSPLTSSFLYSAAGYIYYCHGNNEQARHFLDMATQLALDESMYPALALADHFVVHLQLADGRLDLAEACAQRMGKLLPPDRSCMEAMYQLDLCAIALARNDPREALRHGKEAVRSADESGLRFFQIAYRSLTAHAARLLSEDALADQIISDGLSLARGTIYDSYEALMRYTRSVGAITRGDHAMAGNEVRQALRIAAHSDRSPLVRCTVDLIPDAIQFAIRHDIEAPVACSVARKLRLSPGDDPPRNWPWPVRVCTLGQFRVEIDGQPLQYGRKMPKRDLMLVKLLAAAGPRGMAESRITDEMWPEGEGDLAANSLRQVVHRVRRMLGLSNAVDSVDGVVQLNSRWVWVDSWEVDSLMSRSLTAGLTPEKRAQATARIFELYHGSFLAEESESPRLMDAREAMRGRFVDFVLATIRRFEQEGNSDAALDLCRTALAVESAAEPVCQLYMEHCQRAGRRAEGIAAFDRLRQSLASLQKPPSELTRSLFAALQGGGRPGSAKPEGA